MKPWSRYGVITRATMRIRPHPEVEGFYGAFFRDLEKGVMAVREISQSSIRVSMLRLSDPIETETTLALSGKDKLTTWAGRALKVLGFGAKRCLLIYGDTGNKKEVNYAMDCCSQITRSNGGLSVRMIIEEPWKKSHFLKPYLRNTPWNQSEFFYQPTYAR